MDFLRRRLFNFENLQPVSDSLLVCFQIIDCESILVDLFQGLLACPVVSEWPVSVEVVDELCHSSLVLFGTADQVGFESVFGFFDNRFCVLKSLLEHYVLVGQVVKFFSCLKISSQTFLTFHS